MESGLGVDSGFLGSGFLGFRVPLNHEKKKLKNLKKNGWLLFICCLKLPKKTDESCCCHSRSFDV